MTILEQQGFFWWHDEPVHDDSLTPASYASGLLRIEDNGRSVVELDGYPPDPSDPMGKCIQGLLKVSNERILLSDLRWSGGEFRSNGISFTRFTAMNCLVGHDEAFPHGAQVPEFDSLEIPLDGFEEWLGLGTIKVTRADGKILAGYEKPSDLSYDYDGGTLTITFDVTVDKSGMLGVHRLLLKQSALLRLQLNGTFSLQDLHLQYGIMEDLIKLLTNSDYALAWPRVSSPSGLTCQWYHTRTKHKESASAPKYHDTITRFSELREQFGSIWSKWIALREEIGSGAYMYFGTRRGPELYMEHRFVSLIWGLETFHRSRNTIKKSNALDEKIGNCSTRLNHGSAA